MDSECAVFHAAGSTEDLIQLAQQLSWLSAAFRCIPDDDVYCSATKLLWSGHEAEFALQLDPMYPVQEESCWHQMLPETTIVAGFPVPPRTEKWETGLELDFELMCQAGLIRYPIDYKDGVILKGHSTILIPTRKSTDSVQWHFISNEDSTERLPLSAARDFDVVEGYTIEHLSKLRAFVGYCPEANIHLGTDDSGFATIASSQAKPCGGALHFDSEFTFGVTQYAQLTAKVRWKRGPRFRIETEIQTLNTQIENSQKISALLYDLGSRKAYMVPELSVILHLIHSWASRRLEPRKSRLKMIPMANPCPEGNAFDIYMKSQSTEIEAAYGNEKAFYLSDAFKTFYLALEKRKVFLQRERHGPTLRSFHNRNALEGWDVIDIIDECQEVRLRQTPISASSGGWQSLQQDDNMIVILGRELGQVIRPAASFEGKICSYWARLEPEKDYLIASVHCILQRSNDEKYPSLSKRLYCTELSSQKPHESCPFDGTVCCRLHGLASKRPSKPLDLTKIAQGAVIFGAHKAVVNNQINSCHHLPRVNPSNQHQP